jgi:hypothetical protein
MLNAAQATATVKQLAAVLVEQHELAKKRSEVILSDASERQHGERDDGQLLGARRCLGGETNIIFL